MQEALAIDPRILFVILAWTLPWKGVALWRAAQAGHVRWFIAILVLQTLAILEIAYLFYFSKRREVAAPTSETSNFYSKESHDHAHHNHALDDPVEEWLIKKADSKQMLLDIVIERKSFLALEVPALLNLPEHTASHLVEELIEEEYIIRRGDRLHAKETSKTV